ncbi:hypothetical protein [Sphingobacterium sp. BN32]|uniref:hypothetical protein n=1 Tax=Sphingobacterium sp. BN32 TaxID=3058432 RepID=UPI00265CD6CE|nr:hypothetical protein [Sphingobacterium sp. BN32]WKK60383.1 hypothetical protein QYC40_09090 [Sphingobacterium sp. BN32]
MKLFHSTPTDSYLPLSHENAYLFVHYDKIVNFLTFNVDKKYRHILAKPIKNNYQIDWYSAVDGLQANHLTSNPALANQMYWEFYHFMQEKISELAVRNDDNTRDWIALLHKVFNPTDNVIYTNGTAISIIWGWKFENNDIIRPDLSNRQMLDEPEQEKEFIDSSWKEPFKPTQEKPNNDNELSENIPVELKEEWINVSEEFNFSEQEELPVIAEPIKEEKKRRGFLEFLKDFASKYWWLLLILLFAIILVFFIKSLNQYSF